jgi:hypothetical protein
MEIEDWVMYGAIAVVVLSIGFGIRYAIKEDREWKAWSAEHCKVIKKKASQSIVGFTTGSDGNLHTTFGSTGEQTHYKCDDGIIYIR